VIKRRKATALNCQRDPAQTCKMFVEGKVREAWERLVWGGCETPIADGLRNMLDKYPSRRADVLLRLPSRSYGFFPGCFVRFLHSTSFLNANTHVLI